MEEERWPARDTSEEGDAEDVFAGRDVGPWKAEGGEEWEDGGGGGVGC